MKSKIFIVTLIILLSAFYSCDDVLDRTPLDKISDNDVWQSESLLEGYVYDLYANFPSFAFERYYRYSDEGTMSGGNGNAVTLGTMSKTNVPDDLEYWDYEYIRDCNVFLENIPQSPISEELRNKLEGEVIAMRAGAYLEMAKRYGGVPLVTTVIDPYGIVDDESKKRKNEDEVYQFIDSELTKAIELLSKTVDVKPTARINKWTALALQARANLWAASIAKYGEVQLDGLVGVPAGKAEAYYKKASEAATTVINSGKYSLYNGKTDKAENYQYIFLDEGNSEILFAKEYNGVEVSHDWDHWMAPPRFASGQGARCDPTLELILGYENKDGSEEDYEQYFNENHLYENGWDIFSKKDPRLYATVLFQGVDFVDSQMQTYEGIDTGTVANPVKYYKQSKHRLRRCLCCWG